MLAFDAGIYDWIKLVHILAAIVWVGGRVFGQVYSSRLRRATDQTRLLAFAKDLEGRHGLAGRPRSSSSSWGSSWCGIRPRGRSRSSG